MLKLVIGLFKETAKKIAGVKAVAVDIQVGLLPNFRKTDAEIAFTVYTHERYQSTC